MRDATRPSRAAILPRCAASASTDTSHFHESAGNIANAALALSSASPIKPSPTITTNSARLFIQHHNETCIVAAAVRATCVTTQFICLFTCISRRRLRRCSDILVEGTDAADGQAKRSRVKNSRARGYALLREDRSQTPAIAPIPFFRNHWSPPPPPPPPLLPLPSPTSPPRRPARKSGTPALPSPVARTNFAPFSDDRVPRTSLCARASSGRKRSVCTARRSGSE
ncbi:hypothetical protein HN011_004462 [Eciton burchellii]|nr:hypothetical protein HN011_004462 [Eciton burchellii]